MKDRCIFRKLNRGFFSVLLVMALILSLGACGKKPAPKPEAAAVEASVQAAGDSSTSEDAQAAASEASSAEIIASLPATDATEAGTEATIDLAQFASSEEALIDEGGTYTTKDDVALYIHTYGKLPQNFMTKKQAKKLGWSGGSLESFAPGMCIGGDYFGNYEGILPEDKEYHECDIDTLGKKSRGAKRIIYSDDGYIYYTEDHYESFELLYEP